MANRSYLYAADTFPGQVLEDGTTVVAPRNLRGVAEWKWVVPLLAETLVSSKPRISQSTIWDGPYAIVGEFEEGLAKTLELLDALTHPAAAEGVAAAREALTAPELRRNYFILEAAEIWSLEELIPVDEQARDMYGTLTGPRWNPLRLADFINECGEDEIEESLDETGLNAFWCEHLYFAPVSEERLKNRQSAPVVEDVPPVAEEAPRVAGQPQPEKRGFWRRIFGGS